MSKRTPIQSYDEFDILSGIWILSCNDENPMIIFDGIYYRLGLSEEVNVRELVKRRGELFRIGVPGKRLKDWKTDRIKKKAYPTWMKRNIEKHADIETKINGLETDDVFRNQFRPGKDDPRAPIAIIEWGLEHIDRLRKANAETRAEKISKWTMLWIPILSTIVALVAVVSGIYLQSKTLDTQKSLQETSFAEQRNLNQLKSRQEGYSSFMQSVNEAYDNASKNDANALNTSLRKLESNYYYIEPFLGETKREALWVKYQEFAAATNKLKDQPAETPDYNKLDIIIQKQKDYFHSELYQAFFLP